MIATYSIDREFSARFALTRTALVELVLARAEKNP